MLKTKYMVTVMEADAITLKVRVGKRFTITIPKEVREILGIREGDELDLTIINDSIVLRKSTTLLDFIDRIKPRGSVKVFLEERIREEEVENERVKELTQ